MTENEKYLYNHFLISIKSGFDSLEDIIDDSIAAVEDEGWESEISEEWLSEAITHEYEKHLSESKRWEHPTDTEKLHTVFDYLNQENIVALHNAGYTQSDAIYDANDVWKDIEDEGGKPVGFCYYHGQDLERVIEKGVLLLGFQGAHDKNEKESIIIGNKVSTALKNAGFEINWNNTASKRIEVVNFKWQNIFTTLDETDEKWGYDRAIKLMTKNNVMEAH